MAPIFARLGVKLITRNMAQGGMGTVHSSMGSGSIYGNEVDLLIWDSGTFDLCRPVWEDQIASKYQDLISFTWNNLRDDGTTKS
jgi:hypothetical protein